MLTLYFPITNDTKNTLNFGKLSFIRLCLKISFVFVVPMYPKERVNQCYLHLNNINFIHLGTKLSVKMKESPYHVTVFGAGQFTF